jgi:hypothetical protein
MGKGIRTVLVKAGLGLLAALAIGGPLAASASAALPEFSGPFPKGFTSKSGAVTVETVGGIKLTCTASADKGKITGPKVGTVVVKLSGCVALRYKCTSHGAAEGEIVTNTLETNLGYISGPSKRVGVDLIPAARGGPFTEFTCHGLTIVVRGSVIGQVTPINKTVKALTKFNLAFKQSMGKQKPTSFEGGPTDVLSGSIGETSQEAGLSLSDSIVFSEAVEIHA